MVECMRQKSSDNYPLITKDPVTGDSLIVTRLEGPRSGIVIEGKFDLGWIGRLTPEQLAFVGLLVKYRCNLQKLAGDLNMAYNTARNRMDDIVAALEGSPPEPGHANRGEILDRLTAGTISFEEAMRLLQA
jgi:hypothetical protein